MAYRHEKFRRGKINTSITEIAYCFRLSFDAVVVVVVRRAVQKSFFGRSDAIVFCAVNSGNPGSLKEGPNTAHWTENSDVTIFFSVRLQKAERDAMCRNN